MQIILADAFKVAWTIDADHGAYEKFVKSFEVLSSNRFQFSVILLVKFQKKKNLKIN